MAQFVAPFPMTPPRHQKRFVAQTNINRFQTMLRDGPDAAERRLIQELLAEEFKRLQSAEIQEIRPEIGMPYEGLPQ